MHLTDRLLCRAARHDPCRALRGNIMCACGETLLSKKKNLVNVNERQEEIEKSLEIKTDWPFLVSFRYRSRNHFSCLKNLSESKFSFFSKIIIILSCFIFTHHQDIMKYLKIALFPSIFH
jgi:hypothetical protein